MLAAATFDTRLRRELDAWADAGLVARFWWRDDDAVADTPQLRRLLEMSAEARMVVGLAVVPEQADRSILDVTRLDRCCIWQHGWGHHFHSAGEFGEERPIEAMVEDALRGREAMDRLFGPNGWQRVFVPPNHELSLVFKSLIPGLDYLGVSAGVPLTAPLAHVVEVNAEVDLMDWPNWRPLSEATLCDMLLDQLQQRRTGMVPLERPIGLLTHHLVFEAVAWDLTGRLLQELCDHTAVTRLSAADIFADAQREQRAMSLVEKQGEGSAGVTVVITSCERPDLLARTLDSFFAFNTYPVAEVLVVEDGPQLPALAGDPRYRDRGISWVSTGRRMGQMRAIDVAYGMVRTDYIFHCEDDWEFYAPGFIERSLRVLEHNPRVLQVWLRALDDANRHPIAERTFESGGVPFRYMRPGFDSGEWGIWHGFSFNPGLRRRRDMALIGSFGAVDPQDVMSGEEIERAASAFYLRQGFLAATLVDRDGSGYVRHIGWDRRVPARRRNADIGI